MLFERSGWQARAALTVVIARLDRAIQYSVTSATHGEAAAYWIPRLRGE
ncbi:hypothetical protein ACVIQW_001386 [Bradyrhizobium diazoefficiens]